MNIHSIMNKLIPFFRKKRMARFIYVFKPNKQTQIIDVGGSAFNWDLIQAKSKITLLNLSKPKEMLSTHGKYDFVVGDGTALAFADNQFDIAYSNSVIEHLLHLIKLSYNLLSLYNLHILLYLLDLLV